MEHVDARLSALLLMLTNSPQPNAVASGLAQGTFASIHPRYITVHAVVDTALELRSEHGLSPEQSRMAARVPIEAPAPEWTAVHTLANVSIPDLLDDAHPVLSHHLPSSGGALICVPLLHEARAIGVLSLRAPQLPAATLADPLLLSASAAAVTLWLLADSRTAPAPVRAAQLRVTARQQRVLDGLRRDLTNAAIAAELGFAIGTIKADITAMSAVFGATGREDLVRKAGRAGF